jgi:uncharacterized membrane protein
MHRVLRHLFTTRWHLERSFPRATLAAIEAAIRETEKQHSGELRFAIESRLDIARLRTGLDARTRAHELFALLRVWDTHANNGVLIYLLLAERDIEIVADRGFMGKVAEAEWEAICHEMEARFRAGRFEEGTRVAIERVSELIARHFPPLPGDRNELPDAPVVIG